MTLREEFENEVRKTKTLATVLFETSNKYYIEWLEAKVKALHQDAVSDCVHPFEDVVKREYGHYCLSCDSYMIEEE